MLKRNNILEKVNNKNKKENQLYQGPILKKKDHLQMLLIFLNIEKILSFKYNIIKNDYELKKKNVTLQKQSKNNTI